MIFVRDDDEDDDVVLLEEVEDLAVRSFDPHKSDVNCLLFVISVTSFDHERVTTLLSTSSQSVADDVDSDLIGGILCFDFV